MVRSFEVSCVVLSAHCYVLIGRQIGALSKGFLVGQSTPGHLILLECGQALFRLTLAVKSLSRPAPS